MELHSINLRKVPADPLIDFGSETLGFLNPLGEGTDYLRPAFVLFTEWHEKGIDLREYSRKSNLTKQIVLQDTKTEHDYADILSLASVAKHGSDQSVAQKAVELIEGMKPFKGLTDKDRQARIGAFITITELFKGKYAANITAIGATAKSADFANSLATLQALIQERGFEDAKKPDYTFTDVKKGENDNFTAMRTIINGILNSAQMIDPDIKEKFVQMTGAFNPRIDYYRNTYDPTKHAVDLNSPETTIEILTPQPVIAAAGAKAQVLIKVRHNTGDPEVGTVELREGYDYIKRYENNTSPNPNAKVIAHGIGHYKGEQVATFEIKI
jgi:hypothetical protein